MPWKHHVSKTCYRICVHAARSMTKEAWSGWHGCPHADAVSLVLLTVESMDFGHSSRCKNLADSGGRGGVAQPV